ncbi:MAG: hypothetical protein K2X62_03020 [Beijerinckiaceae bacterium]|jgi:hypothetical protein|nr:hypothetical protein [Beijerinckiaceae bacterium]MDO9439748.1 hypothetical protein [Beijerinckiaceae bacterium]
MNLDLCVEHCLDAARSCEEAWFHARSMDGPANDEALFAALSDAARVSALSADRLVQVRDLTCMLASVCAEVVGRAATACAAYRDDEVLAACAENCAACMEACYALLAAETVETAPPALAAPEDDFAEIEAMLQAGVSERITEIQFGAASRSAA